MKKVTCTDIGGPSTCNATIIGANADEMIANGWTHMQEAHPQQAKQIMANSKEVNDRWMSEFKSQFNTLHNA